MKKVMLTAQKGYSRIMVLLALVIAMIGSQGTAKADSLADLIAAATASVTAALTPVGAFLLVAFSVTLLFWGYGVVKKSLTKAG